MLPTLYRQPLNEDGIQTGVHNDVRVEEKGRRVQQPHKRLKFDHGSSITNFSLCANVYKHVYGDLTKDEKEKTQYQDTICSEAEEGNGDRP